MVSIKALYLTALGAAGATASTSLFYITDFVFNNLDPQTNQGNFDYSFAYFETSIEFIGTCQGQANNGKQIWSSLLSSIVDIVDSFGDLFCGHLPRRAKRRECFTHC